MTKLGMYRIVIASLAIVVVVSGVVGKLNYGGICSLGAGEVWATCPLGFVERSLAAGELLPWWPSALLAALSVIVLGRIFCAWVCPASLLRRLFGNNGRLESKREPAPNGYNWGSYSSYAFLGGVLLASLLFRFPIFCLFCPIGLFFGAVYAVIKLFSPDPLSVGLVLFPVLLSVELVVLKKAWCRSICPLGALLSIFGNLNRLFVPAIRQEKCLTSKGINCRVCERACPEGINLAKIRSRFSPNSCTKCLECFDKCPKGAVTLPVLKPRRAMPTQLEVRRVEGPTAGTTLDQVKRSRQQG